MRTLVRPLLLLMLFAAALAAARTEQAPVVHQRCTDLTGTLSAEELRGLNEKLLRFEEETSNQVVVLVVRTAGEEAIEEYALRVAEANKLGKKGRDNGVLLLVAKDDRTMRIEVGYGLEGVLPDATSNQIMRTIIAPRFRDGDFYAGLDAGVDAIIAATKGEFQGDGSGGKRPRTRSVPMILIILIMIIASMIGSGMRRRRHYIGSGGYWGGFGGGGFGGGGFGGGGGGGGGGGFGGFSGGGGSFGGGGSSGSW